MTPTTIFRTIDPAEDEFIKDKFMNMMVITVMLFFVIVIIIFFQSSLISTSTSV